MLLWWIVKRGLNALLSKKRKIYRREEEGITIEVYADKLRVRRKHFSAWPFAPFLRVSGKISR
jgi:hypothetical protein